MDLGRFGSVKKGTAWRPIAALASLAIFVSFVYRGHWSAGLFYALIPVLYLLSVSGRAIAGVPLDSWLLLVILWSTALLAGALGVREMRGDLPDHVGLAIAAWLGALALGGFAAILSVGVHRMIRSHRP